MIGELVPGLAPAMPVDPLGRTVDAWNCQSGCFLATRDWNIDDVSATNMTR
jgi:hypothetical protein